MELDNGVRLTESYAVPQYYKVGGSLKPINRNPKPDPAYNARFKPDRFDHVPPLPIQPVGFEASEGPLSVHFETIGFGGVRISKAGKDVRLVPVTSQIVVPQLLSQDGFDYIEYHDVWPGVDLRYRYQGGALEEYIDINRPTQQHSFPFRLEGARASVDVDGAAQFAAPFDKLLRLGALGVAANLLGPVAQAKPLYRASSDGRTLSIEVSSAWLTALAAENFPVVVDPYIEDDTGIPGGWTGEFTCFKSDGWVSNSQQSNPNVGSLNDHGWKIWRTVLHLPYEHVFGRQLLAAYADMSMTNQAGWEGYHDDRTVWLTWATCFGYDGCTNSGAPRVSGTIGLYGTINVTPLIQWLMDNNVRGGWLMMGGDEGRIDSYKQISPVSIQLRTYTNLYPTQPSPTLPSTDRDAETVVVTPTPQVAINASSDPNGDPLTYRFHVATTNGFTAWDSGWQSSRTWIIPEGVLQDGVSYVWRVSVNDGWWASPAYRMGGFKIDMRTGRDKVGTYDNIGPVDVGLNTGDVVTSTSSHSIPALGGPIGLGLNYSTPLRSRMGLLARYFDTPGGGPTPKYTRVEPNINFNWDLGSPIPGMIPADNFAVNWQGNFFAPQEGDYYFGASNDDNMSMSVDGQTVFDFGCCQDPGWSQVPIHLRAGQAVPINVWHIEYGGLARAILKVRGAVPEQVVPTEWLRTPALPVERTTGLTGHYYTYTGDSTPDPTTLTNSFMVRNDPAINFDYNEQGPAPAAPTDRFYIRWSGYFTAPTSGTYNLIVGSDDGARLWLDNNLILDAWWPRGYTETPSSPVALTAGQTVPIRLDYFEAGGPGSVRLLMDGPAGRVIIDTRYLSPGGRVLPAGWTPSIDAGGNLAYQHLSLKLNGDVVLDAADASEHTFKFTGTGYKPPINEESILVRNIDASFTLTDVDGRTYTFAVNGTLQSTTLPLDDRRPAALQYDWATQNGMPKLQRIVDRVDPTRFATLYYQGDPECAVVPSGFDATPPNMMCAFITYNGDRTSLYYHSGQLARVEMPGDVDEDFGYDTNGILVSYRDPKTNEAIVAGRRTADNTALTEISYDALSRATTVRPPAAEIGAPRLAHLVEYLPNVTKRHIEGTPEPKGYLQLVEYDDKYRTTKVCNSLALCSTSEWNPDKDLLLGTTDPMGLKATTIYDNNDLPTDQYGPAPAAWFGADRRPTSDFLTRAPHTETHYDEGIHGLAAAYFDYRLPGGATEGMLFGAPKLHTTGLPARPDGAIQQTFSPPPIAIGDGMNGWGLSLVGKVLMPETGDFRFKCLSDDGCRVAIDDTLVVNDFHDGGWREHSTGTFSNPTAGSWHRIKVDYYDAGGSDARLEMQLARPGGDLTSDIGDLLTPLYGLSTTVIDYDAELGNGVTKTIYGDPALGLPRSSVLDPSGLALTATPSFESPSSGFLRQTSKTLPGGNTTTYLHWGAHETADNPCTPAVEAFKQAGLPRGRIDPDPDAAGPLLPRRSEMIRDDAGHVVASRLGTEPWTCMQFDARGRLTTTMVPSAAGRPGRTITNTYVSDGNPLVTTSADPTGIISITTDLLGRTKSYRDALGNTTNTEYNDLGHLASRTGPLGVETFVYNDYGQMTSLSLDGVVLATPTYDQYGQLQDVNVNKIPGVKLSIARDVLNRTIGQTYLLPRQTSGLPSTLTEEVTRSQSGSIYNQKINGVSLSGANPALSFDGAGRLNHGSIAGNDFTYEFGAADANCASKRGSNPLAGRNSNRIRQTVNGVSTWNCYNFADQLIASSDSSVGTNVYDSHGNTTRMGNTYFGYDNGDRNQQITWGSTRINYARDVQSRVVQHDYTHLETTGGQTSSVTTTTYYGFTGPGDSPDFLMNASRTVVEKYLPLPGGLLLTIRPTASSSDRRRALLSLSNLHGDVITQVGATGQTTQRLELYDPFGNVILPTGDFLNANPSLRPVFDTNTSVIYSRLNAAQAGWLGGHDKFSEAAIVALRPIQMGARVYIPKLGRFLQMDPVEGGTDNNYVYVTDPVNDFDLDGQWGWSNVKKFAKDHWKEVAIGVTIGLFCGATAGIGCAVAAGAGAGAVIGAGSSVGNQINGGSKFSFGKLARDTIAGGLTGGASGAIGYGTAKGLGYAARSPGVQAFLRKLSPYNGQEFTVGTRFRIKPAGFLGGSKWAERLPHYHWRGSPRPGRYGIGWHRPWETLFRRWFR